MYSSITEHSTPHYLKESQKINLGTSISLNQHEGSILQTLYETKILWHIIAQCPNCLQKVKEGLKNQPLPRQENQNEIQQGSI